MRLTFFSKCLKFNVDAKNARKNWKKVFSFSDNCIWIGSGKFSLTVNLLSSPKISDLIKNNFFQLNLAQNDEKAE